MASSSNSLYLDRRRIITAISINFIIHQSDQIHVAITKDGTWHPQRIKRTMTTAQEPSLALTIPLCVFDKYSYYSSFVRCRRYRRLVAGMAVNVVILARDRATYA